MIAALSLDNEFKKKPSGHPANSTFPEKHSVRKASLLPASQQGTVQSLASQRGRSGAILEKAHIRITVWVESSFHALVSSGPAAGPGPPLLEGSQASSPQEEGPPACGWALYSPDSKLSVSFPGGRALGC